LMLSITDFEGVKILMKQDEQVNSGELGTLVRDKGFDIVFTCLSESEHEKVYPRGVIGSKCTLIRTLTGYVSPIMRQGLPNVTKDLGVTYRGSIQPLEFGKLGYEKRGIGYDMHAALAHRGNITSDISSRWEDRLSGTAWETFLRRSNVVLGVESGSNIFDFDGSIVAWCRSYEERHRGEDPSTYQYYLQAHNEFLGTVEGNVNYAQISPRHFEAAAAGAAQLLYEGEYSNLFHPNRHFFPLRRDLSNIDDVVDFIQDDVAQKKMACCSFEEIILNKTNWYESFIERADAAIDVKLIEKGLRTEQFVPATTVKKPSAYILCAHDPKIDPRVNWFAETLQQSHDVTVIGTYHFNVVGDRTTTTMQDSGVRIIRAERTLHEQNWVPTAGELREGNPSYARFLLSALADYAVMPTKLLKAKLGATVAEDVEVQRFRTICEYMVNTNAALLNTIERLGAPNLVVGVDQEALFAATICAEVNSVPVVFDAHEYWPYSYTDFQHWEIEFWSAMEGRLSALTDINIAVTPQLSSLMGHEYGVEFRTLPNAASIKDGRLASLEEDFQRRMLPAPLKVLYQGGFAEGRGLEEVLRAWVHVKSDACLILRGPENEYRSRIIAHARSLGLTEERVSFPAAVEESDLISKAREADVGLISYNPVLFGYRYCCPNKLSQYAAAGLPILSSTTEFVADMIKKHDIGYVIDINQAERFAEVIDWLSANRDALVQKGRRARQVFETSFNWEVLGAELFREIAALSASDKPREPKVDWIDSKRRVGDDRSHFTFTSSHVAGEAGTERNILAYASGARLVSSSPFFEFPNDAGHLLRGSGIGYAAAIHGTGTMDWLEFELGTAAIVDEAFLVWLDEDNRATAYRIKVRATTNSAWVTVVDEQAAGKASVKYKFPRMTCRYVRLETDDYIGQRRMLIRRFELLESEVQSVVIDPGTASTDAPALPQLPRPSSVKRKVKRILRVAAKRLGRIE